MLSLNRSKFMQNRQVKTTAVKREKKRTAVEASVSEELLKLKALSLSFVKEIPIKLVGQLTQSLSDKSYSGEGKDLSWASDCETMSDVDDIEDETFSKVSITEKTLVERNRNSQ
ncbi:Hypothetical protein NTJ_00564 [Nesidiocoris tenuis]|uniref:Uncharacterized protein n=1 Tax=Nesidiocoris tenuis TaxID=355587 RepID=A0ABN7A748_9HEMI|nr:Hypothetical protein NTJ_00564 [Nesidiocoris tenuis]